MTPQQEALTKIYNLSEQLDDALQALVNLCADLPLLDKWRYLREACAVMHNGNLDCDMEILYPLENELRRAGYRKCDIAACNCHSWHLQEKQK